MPRSASSRTPRWALPCGAVAVARVEQLAFALGIIFVLAFVTIAVVRLSYRFEATWLESVMYQMTQRRMLGESIYAPPSLSYVPFLYPPLFFDLSAFVAKLLGYGPGDVTFVPMRLVSILASVALFLLTSLLVRSKGATLRTSVALGSVVLATYGRFEGWQDSSRVDSLYSLLAVSGAALLLEGRRARSAAISGVFFGAATLTKQPGAVLMVLAALPLAVDERHRVRVVWVFASSAVTVVGYLMLTHELSNPMLYHYLFAVPASHPLQARLFMRGLFFLPVTVPFLFVWVAYVLVDLIRRGRPEWHAAVSACPWSTMLLPWFVATVVLRAKQGASINFFMPLIPVMAVSAAEGAAHASRAPSRLTRLLPFFPAAQLLALAYDPRPLVATRADARTAAALVEQLRRIEGPVWFPAFPSYAALAGKPWYAHQVALADIARTDPQVTDRSLALAVQHGTFGGLVLSPDDPLADHPALGRYRHDALPEIESPFLRALHRNHVSDSVLIRSTGPTASGYEPHGFIRTQL